MAHLKGVRVQRCSTAPVEKAMVMEPGGSGDLPPHPIAMCPWPAYLLLCPGSHRGGDDLHFLLLTTVGWVLGEWPPEGSTEVVSGPAAAPTASSFGLAAGPVAPLPL